MFNYTRVSVERSETLKFNVDVAPWEVPVVAAVNGEDRTTVVEDVPVNRELPEAQSEYDRLAAKYKIDTETGQSYVAMVYGVGALGVERLDKAIGEVREFRAPPAPKVVKAAKGRRRPAPVVEEAPAGDVGEDFDPTAELFVSTPAVAEGAKPISE